MTHLRFGLAALAALAASPAFSQELTIYSGRGEPFVAPVIAAFTERTGIEVNVRYAGTAELAILLQEERGATPADLFWAQDAAALGAVVESFAALPQDVLDAVPPAYRDDAGRWIATSGRGRVLVYSPERLDEADFPETLADLTDEKYKGRVAVPPTNGSFQAHLTALRVSAGEDAARDWVDGLVANEPIVVQNNGAVLQAIADGEADLGVVNNYYLPRRLAADPEFPVASRLFDEAGDIGNLLLVAGVGVLSASDNQDNAMEFIRYVLSPQAQQYFISAGYEYPVTREVISLPGAPTMEELEATAPDVDLNTINDLEGTLDLLRDAGLL